MKRNSSVWIYISLALLSLLLLLGSAAVCYAALFGGKSTQYLTLQIPGLVGAAWDKAALSDDFFSDVTYICDDTYPAGTVISQSPAGGIWRTTRKGQPIRLRISVSLGKQTVRMPALCGTDVRQAEQRLRALGLLVRTKDSFASGHTPYDIISQSAAPDTLLPLGSEVTLIYASPNAYSSVRVPDICGMDAQSANTALLRAGLLPGAISYADGASALDFCYVTRQSIPKGSRVPTGTTIDYTLSRTVIPWNFPNAEESSKESAAFTQ